MGKTCQFARHGFHSGDFFCLFRRSLRFRSFPANLNISSQLSNSIIYNELVWYKFWIWGRRHRCFWQRHNRQPQSNEGIQIQHQCIVHISLVVEVIFRSWVAGIKPFYVLLMQDVEVTSPPDDSISCLAFSPPTFPGNFLIGGSWANDVSY